MRPEPITRTITTCESLPESHIGTQWTERNELLDPEGNPPHSPLSDHVTPQNISNPPAGPSYPSPTSAKSPLDGESPLSRRSTRKQKKATRSMGSPCGRSEGFRAKTESPESVRKPDFEIKRFESPEVKATAYAGYDLDYGLTRFFNKGSAQSTKSNTPVRSPRGCEKKTVCFSKDIEIISHDGTSDRASRSPSPKRSAERLSSAETAKIVQKELEEKATQACNRLINNLKLEEHGACALEDLEANTVNKPRWRVP